MSLTIEIKVVPSSGRQKWLLDKSGQLKCFLKSPPEKGQANAELIQFLAKTLGLPQAAVEIVSGQTARKKRIKIAQNLTYQELLRQLGLQEIDKQVGLFS